MNPWLSSAHPESSTTTPHLPPHPRQKLPFFVHPEAGLSHHPLSPPTPPPPPTPQHTHKPSRKGGGLPELSRYRAPSSAGTERPAQDISQPPAPTSGQWDVRGVSLHGTNF